MEGSGGFCPRMEAGKKEAFLSPARPPGATAWKLTAQRTELDTRKDFLARNV